MSIQKRLAAFTSSWPRSLADDFRLYCCRFSRQVEGRQPASSSNIDYPFWVLLPGWMLNRYSYNNKNKYYSRNFLKDLLWIQYCLLFFTRIQDDLFDGHTANTSLIFASNLFFLEAERVLSQYFGSSSRFWEIYRDSLKESSCAIVEIAAMQRTPRIAPKKLINAYARVAAQFNIGLAAICTVCERMKHFPYVTKFATEMVIAGQLMDDLKDIEEDLQNSRYNYAANRLLRQGGESKITENEAPKVIAKTILLTDGVNKLFSEVKNHLALAEEALKPLNIPEAKSLVRRYQEGMDKMQDKFHRCRVDFLFEGI